MTSSQGLGRCAHLRLLTRSLEQEATANKALLEGAFSCSPWVEQTAEGVCTFELRNARSDPETLARRVIEHLSRLDLEARVGFAANADLALLAAHAAQPSLVVHDARTFLIDLPVAVLDTGLHAAAILQGWGIGTLGALGALPPQELTRRLGQEGRALWERANGRSQRLLRLASLPVSYEESLEFEYEVQTLEPLLFVLRRFLDQLVLRLGNDLPGTRRVDVEAALRGRVRNTTGTSRFPRRPTTMSRRSFGCCTPTWRILRLRRRSRPSVPCRDARPGHPGNSLASSRLLCATRTAFSETLGAAPCPAGF